MLDGELRNGHLWLHIERVVAMVIVTLLEKSVVCCLVTNERVVSNAYRVYICVYERCCRTLELRSSSPEENCSDHPESSISHEA